MIVVQSLGLHETSNKGLHETSQKQTSVLTLEGKGQKKELNKRLLLQRTSPHYTTNIAPAKVLFNREINNGIPQLPKLTAYDIELHETDAQNKLKTKVYTDQKYKTKFHDIEVGDKVLVKNMKKENKLQSWSYILRLF